MGPSNIYRRAVAIGAIAAAFALPAAGANAAATQPPPAPPASSADVDGFRSARFGMSESAVRAAIESDFQLSGSSVIAADNELQRTPVLRIHVPDLVPGGGIAQIDYIFGYHSRALIEVNILWSAATDSHITSEQLIANGGALQAYLQKENFAPDRTVRNRVLRDGNVLLFRTRDFAGHAIVLVLSGKRETSADGKSFHLTPTALTLAYAANPAHPDVFELKNGAF
jgi:hypothetical protein